MNTAESNVTRLKTERQEHIQAAAGRLAAWPEYQAQIAAFLPHQDQTTDLLEKYLAWIAALAQMPRPFELSREVTSLVTGGNILDLLSLPFHELLSVQVLLDRFDRVKVVLDGYVAEQQRKV